MKFRTKIINYLDLAPTASPPIETARDDDWKEDTATVSSDLGSGTSPDQQIYYIEKAVYIDSKCRYKINFTVTMFGVIPIGQASGKDEWT